MDNEISSLKRQLQEDPLDWGIRSKLTIACYRAYQGDFLAWRGGESPPISGSYQVILEYPITPPEDEWAIRLSSIESTKFADFLKQDSEPKYHAESCWIISILDLKDLQNLMKYAPSACLTLTENNIGKLTSFHGRRNHQIDASLWRLEGLLYDTLEIPAGEVKRFYKEDQSWNYNLSFFQIPLGAADWNGKVKDFTDTNIDQGGSLSYPKNFEIEGISLVPFLDTNLEDYSEFLDKTCVRLLIGTMDRIRFPTRVCCPQGTHQSNSILRVSTPFNPCFNFEYELVPQQNFRVDLIESSNQPVFLRKSIKLRCFLHGYYKIYL